MNLAQWLLAGAVAVQLAVPARMIAGRERVLRTGLTFKFKAAPVDPYDAFRGRYVDLRFAQHQATVQSGVTFALRSTLFVSLEVDADGFARFGSATVDAPQQGPYLRARAGYQTSGTVAIELPFDRFYMHEKLAPDAERLYREHTRGTTSDAYVTVRVADGEAVIENLFVGGRPITEVLRGGR
jgi:uncharacterized membrane-anchored protein